MAEVDTSIYKIAADADPFEFQNRLLENRQRQQSVEANNIKLATERFKTINDAASGILSDPELGKTDVTKKLWDTLGRLTKGDAMTAQHAVQFMQQFPTDPQQQRQAIQNVHAQTLGAWERGKAYLGTVEGVGTGGGTKLIQQPAFGGAPPRELGYIPNTLQPGERTINANPSDPNFGQETTMGVYGNAPIQPPAAAPAAPIRAPRPVPAPAAAPTIAPASAAPGRAKTPSDSPTFSDRFDAARPVTKLAPGTPEAMQVAGGESGKSLADARNRSLNYQQEVNPLEQAIPALEKLGTRGTGPGTESINQLKSFVLSNVPGADFKGLKDGVETYDKAKKYLTDFVNQNGNSSTNDKLAAAFAGNPSVNISNAAAVDVAKTALALRRFKQAQLLAFEKSGKTDAEFAKEAGKFAREHDPRAYGFDMMSPAERKKVIESLPKGKREMFMLDVQSAMQDGIIKPPQAKP